MGWGSGIATFCTVGNNDGVTGENLIVRRDFERNKFQRLGHKTYYFFFNIFQTKTNTKHA